MKTFLVASALSLCSLAAIAQQPQNPSGVPALPSDANMDLVASDLRTVARVAGVAEDLGRVRQVLLDILDSDIKTLRGPREDGTYQWASLQREEGGRVSDEKSVEYVFSEKVLREVTLTGANAYRVEVSVPKKRGTFQANNSVFVRNVIVDSTLFDGRTVHHEIPINVWVEPGDATGGPLPEIGKSVKALVELGVEKGDKQAVAKVSLVQAKLADDPNSPYYPAVTRLVAIRDLAAAKEINRGQLKNAADEALVALPGELEKRNAQLAAADEQRKQMAANGTMRGSIALGDATPDVVNELTEIQRLMNGTVAEQAEGRDRLTKLIAGLTPARVQ
ncbi:MAG: hypothetical protein JO197_10525 [Acidobacteria bacterium]|nr:hypothetical protein [Acidobacteriota bacterium]MBV9475511.1 hypothetical protein [Acidobacteriota bacterium]